MNPECDRCLFNTHDPHILCAVHPEGVEESCVDFKPDRNEMNTKILLKSLKSGDVAYCEGTVEELVVLQIH
jgi:hypothetical protein